MNFIQNICTTSVGYYILILYCCIALNLKILPKGLAERNVNNYHDNIGWISPSGEVIKHTGEALEMFCTINPELKLATVPNGTNLVFLRNETYLDTQNVTRVNRTTISLHLSNANESNYVYECVLTEALQEISTNVANGNGYNSFINDKYVPPISANHNASETIIIGTTHVVVGGKPKDVQNFRCFLEHWSALNCLWELPVNYVPTSYTVQYVPMSLVTTEKTVGVPNCLLTNDSLIKKPRKCPFDKINNFCFWSPITNPPYLNVYETLDITLIGENTFGNLTQNYIFNQSQHMKPEAPSDLNFFGVTSHSIKLEWHFDRIPHYPDVDWIFRVQISNKFDPQPQSFSLSTKCVNKSRDYVFHNFKNMEPNVLYKCSISQKLMSAPNYEEYWSHSSKITVRTKPLPATYVPETEVGLFQILNIETADYRNVRIFWKPMEYSRLYGDFHYVTEASEVDDFGNKQVDGHANQVVTKNHWAKFKIGHSSYRFVIRSANSEGRAPNACLITVPSTNSIIQERFSYYAYIIDYYYDDQVTEVLQYYESELNWRFLVPEEQAGIVNYTLYWDWWFVDSYGRRLGNINVRWIILPANVSKHRIRMDIDSGVHQNGGQEKMKWNFGISANTRTSSTGLQFSKVEVFSVSNMSWNTGEFSIPKQQYLNQSSNIARKNNEVPPKRVTYKGFKFSENQFQKWMDKLHGVEP